MNIIQKMSEHARSNLRGNLHKVAAAMAKNDGVNFTRDEVTIKEAAYLIGTGFWKNYLTKRALFDGLMHLQRLK